MGDNIIIDSAGRCWDEPLSCGRWLDAILRDTLADKVPEAFAPYVQALPLWWSLGIGVALLLFWYRKAIFNAIRRRFAPDRYRRSQGATVEHVEALGDGIARIRAQLEELASRNPQPPLNPEQEQRRDLAIADIVAEGGVAAADLEAGDLDEAIRALKAQARADTQAAAQKWRRIGDLLNGANTAEALAAYEEAFKLQPNDFWTCIELARLRQIAGRLDAALEAMVAAEKVTTTDRERLIVFGWSGDLTREAGDLLAAHAHHQENLDIARRLARDNPASAQAQRDLSISLIKLGDLTREAGNLATARALYQESQDITRRLARDNPTNTEVLRDLSANLERLGDLMREAGDLSAARAHYQESLDIARRLARDNPTSAQAQRDLSVSLNKLGDLTREAGDLTTARAQYQESLDIRRRLARDNPASAQAQRDFSVSLNKLGDLTLGANDLTAARALYQEGLNIRRRLSHSNPASAEAQRDLSFELERLGDLAAQEGRRDEAIAYYAESLPIARRLAEEHPEHPGLQNDLKITEARLEQLRSGG